MNLELELAGLIIRVGASRMVPRVGLQEGLVLGVGVSGIGPWSRSDSDKVVLGVGVRLWVVLAVGVYLD